jgi:NADH dehydrogenase
VAAEKGLSGQRPRIVVVGAGFAGFHAARRLRRLLRGRADLTVLNPTDYFLYVPLLPEVAAGVVDPREVLVPLSTTLRGVRLILGSADQVDLDNRSVTWSNEEGQRGELAYDQLILAPGSVNKLLPIPGVTDHAHGFRSVAEALYLRDHLIEQLELADASSDVDERRSRCTFVVVGAGYTGVEVAAQGQLLTAEIARLRPGLRNQPFRWLLLDVADRLLPELDERLATAAEHRLTSRGVEVRMGTSVEKATSEGVELSDGEFVSTNTLVWCVGVRPDELIDGLGLPTEKGRLVVNEYLAVDGRPEVSACGDAAAVPDLTKPGSFTPMTAQHAVRQGKVVANNVAAAHGMARPRRYKHHDLGFVVDLGGFSAAANPLGVPLSGLPAKVVTRAYHLAAIPANRARIASDWLLDAVQHRQAVRLGLVEGRTVPLDPERAA